jgi:hypothetical protein
MSLWASRGKPGIMPRISVFWSHCRRLELSRLRYPHHNSVRIQHEGKSVIFDKAKALHSFVKGSRLLGVFGRNESNDVRGTQHGKTSYESLKSIMTGAERNQLVL